MEETGSVFFCFFVLLPVIAGSNACQVFEMAAKVFCILISAYSGNLVNRVVAVNDVLLCKFHSLPVHIIHAGESKILFI